MKVIPCLVLGLALAAVSSVACASEEVRTWTSAGGQTVQARLVGVSRDGGTLTLVNADGERFRIRQDRLCAADREYVRLTQLKKVSGPQVVYEGENITFSVDRDGVLYLRGTASKTTWPNGRPPKPKRSRHTGKLMPVKADPSKRPVVVQEQITWTNTPPAELVGMLAKVVERSELAVKGRSSVERYRICGGLELDGDQLRGLSVWFHADAALMDLSGVKREMRYKQGNLAFATVTVSVHDGKANSDLSELSETLNEHQQKELLNALRGIPFDKLKRDGR